MGAEGNITLKKIAGQHELITEGLPVFRVTEPLAFMPIYISYLHGVPWPKMYQPFADMLTFGYLEYQVAWLHQAKGWTMPHSGPCFGVLAVPLREFDRIAAHKKNTERLRYIGGKDVAMLRPIWAAITNGYWLVEHYSDTSDTIWWWDDDKSRPAFRTDDKVTWEIWT